jgi:glycosyltransferase involved in cell wall biosynthesis
MAASASLKMLYLCYFDLKEPLVQTQVLPYLEQLVTAGVNVNLLTFERRTYQEWTRLEREEQKRGLAARGINWFCLPYHKRPSLPATAYDIIAGAFFAVRLARRERIDVFHARAHVPMAMALLAQRLTGGRLVFDVRGLMAEEYVDAGIWKKNSLPFKAVKKLERKGLQAADQIVVLTRKMRSWLLEHGLATPDRVEVIPCCFDFSRLPDDNGLNHLPDRFEVVYAGSVTGLYMLKEMGQFFLKLRRQEPRAFFRVLTMSSPVDAAAVLRQTGLSDEDFFVGAVAPEDVPTQLGRARLGLSFRMPTFSQIAASPTKIGEYLAAGLPVVCNAGTGDVDELLLTENLGVILSGFDDSSYADAVLKVLKLAHDGATRERAKRVARRHFDLVDVGGAGYRNVYRRLCEPASADRL